MLKINETATAYDLGEFLENETGVFQCTSPQGEQFQVVSRAGQSIVNLRPSKHDTKKGNPQTWRIRKIGELRNEQEVT